MAIIEDRSSIFNYSAMTGDAMSKSKSVPETTKRRLSLRLGQSGSPEKKARSVGEAVQHGVDSNLKSKGEEENDPESPTTRDSNTSVWATNQQPSTASTSRFNGTTSRSSRSPSTGFSDIDPPSRDSRRTSSKSGRTNRSVAAQSTDSGPSSNPSRSTLPPPHRQPHSHPWDPPLSMSAPRWRTSSQEHDQPTPTQPTRPPRNPDQPSSSAPSRLPSPPPSFSLSSGQPLVNPPLKTQAAFVGKLYAMLEDEEIKETGLIYWSQDGQIFTCPNPTEFARIVLPRYFKHNNWQSFVRQLNMYSSAELFLPSFHAVFLPPTSFSKVNDLFATTSDPGAWEFRHPLFKRGEPHLLASIKRKTTRPSTQEGAPLASPTEEFDAPRAIAGWMRDVPNPNSHRTSSPPRDLPPPTGIPRSRIYGYNLQTGEAISQKGSVDDRRPTSRGYQWSSDPPDSASTMMPPPSESAQHRIYADSMRQTLSTGRSGHGGYPDSPFYPQPQHSPVDVLSGQVATLEDRLQRLIETLNNERLENVRTNMDFTSYLLQLSGWIGNGQVSQQPDLRALQEALSRSNGDLSQRYEALVASNTLNSMGSSDRRRPGDNDQRFPPTRPGISRHPHPTLPDPRSRLTGGPTPRTSPLIGSFAPEVAARQLHPLNETQLGDSLYSNHSLSHHSLRTGTQVPPVRESNDRLAKGNPTDVKERLDEDEPMEDVKPVKGLSSLLN